MNRSRAAAFALALLLAACSTPAPSTVSSAPAIEPPTAAPTPTPTPTPRIATPTAAPTPTPTPTPSPAPSGPLPGDLLIADRGNGRLLIVTPGKHVVWSVTLNSRAGWRQAPLAADDAFFTPDGRSISINAENQEVIARVDVATRRIVWSYGHDGFYGSAPGYLNTPDDAYPLANGHVLVADIRNERILEIAPSGRIVRQLGRTGVRWHNPPYSFASPNGDTPLPDGGLLVTEIGGAWVDRLNAAGHLVWSFQLAGIHYPSDAQLLANGNVLVVDYYNPGTVEEVTRHGRIVWRYRVLWGSGRLDHPSLAIALPNGLIAVTDDFNDRVVVINPGTHRIVWQYGHTRVPGRARGYLNGPDGIDLVPGNAQLPPA